MAYTHGTYVYENPTSVIAPLKADSAIQVIIGTAPVNLVDNPASVVNKPILVNSFAEAAQAVGYSDSFDKFTLCQSIDASFRVFNVAPLILINVLDPAVHKIAVTDSLVNIVNGKVTIEEEGILLNEAFVVKSEDGAATYTKNTDYTVAFDSNGYPVVSVVSSGTIPAGATKLKIGCNKLDPSAVKVADIIGGYDAATGKYTGMELIEQIYPRLGVLPGLLLAPGWSKNPTVAAVMMAKCEGINGVYKCDCILDTDTAAAKVYTEVYAWKNNNGFTDKHAFTCWPKVKVGEKTYFMSALLGALIAYTDAQNEGVPFVSPSNKSFRITAAVLEDGTEVYLDQLQANYLNGQGIITALNVNGWRAWGNNTGAYPGSTDVKDRFIAVRRMFDWWSNTFILTYFQKVDDPLNYRLIESVVDSENIRANGYKARGQIADARIEYNQDENPTTDLLNGTIRFRQYLTPFTPAETIINTLEFDPDALTAALTGGES